MPRVSVITPTFNRADMIGDAIQSVLNQTCDDWELIIVDDGSHDNTREVVARYADPRIHYIYQENRGLPGARNTGIRNARGEYVAFLDSDDLFLPDKLRAQVAALDAHANLGLIASGYTQVNKQLEILREAHPWKSHPHLGLATWVYACPVIVNSILVRREWLEQVGMFDEEMKYVEDWDLWLRLALAGCEMAWLEQIVCYYRLHGDNMVRNFRLMKSGMLRMLDKLYAHADLPGKISAQRDWAYANVNLNAAARGYAAGAVDQAKESLAEALRLNPSLKAGKPPRVFDTLASFALSPLCNDAYAFMDALVGNLPSTDMPKLTRRQSYGLLHAVSAFDAHQQQRYRQVINESFHAILADASWLMNRGFLAITFNALKNNLQS